LQDIFSQARNNKSERRTGILFASFFLMKVFITLLFFFTVEATFAQLQLAKGDNIYASFRKLKKTREALMPPLGNWTEESNITAVADSAFQTPSIVYFRSATNKLFAAHNHVAGTVAIDLDGDSVIDTETSLMWLPAWTFKKTVAASKDSTAFRLLNKIYETTMQSDQNDYADSAVSNLLNKYRTNISLPDRNIIYLFDSYRRITLDASKQKQKPPAEICLSIADELSNECMKAFGKIPTIVAVYKGEAMLNSSLYSVAHQHFKTWLTYYPNSVALQVYDYKMEENKAEKERKRNLLKANHPNHWMVKELDK
jgi:hypothetical protein